MKVVDDRAELRRARAAWRDERVALVPTMGNLHPGHLALIAMARRQAARVVVSLFVNPTQFGPGEDFESYPRTPHEDLDQLRAAGCDLVFMPQVQAIYPHGLERAVRVSVPEVGDDLCGGQRPGHFDGVASVVARLLLLVAPDVAIFGEKDYQQLMVIRRLVSDLGIDVEIASHPIVRAEDGLALSSRNRYLSAAERRQAPALYRTLCWLRDEIQGAETGDDALLAAGLERLREAGFEPEYLELRRADDLGPARADDQALVVLAAARMGPARLIDNVTFVRAA